MRLATLRKKRKSLGNMPQTVSCSYSLGGHGTHLNATDRILVIVIFNLYEFG